MHRLVKVSYVCTLYSSFGFVPIIILVSSTRPCSHLELQNSGQTCVISAFTYAGKGLMEKNYGPLVSWEKLGLCDTMPRGKKQAACIFKICGLTISTFG